MATRLFALLLTLAFVVQGALPALPGWRCPEMGRRSDRACCPAAARSSDDLTPRLDARCCEPVGAPVIEARTSHDSPAPRLAAGPPAAACDLPPPTPTASAIRQLACLTLPFGAPSGERLRLYSPILRV